MVLTDPITIDGDERERIYGYVEAHGAVDTRQARRDLFPQDPHGDPQHERAFRHNVAILKRDGYLEGEDDTLRIAIDLGRTRGVLGRRCRRHDPAGQPGGFDGDRRCDPPRRRGDDLHRSGVGRGRTRPRGRPVAPQRRRVAHVLRRDRRRRRRRLGPPPRSQTREAEPHRRTHRRRPEGTAGSESAAACWIAHSSGHSRTVRRKSTRAFRRPTRRRSRSSRTAAGRSRRSARTTTNSTRSTSTR